MKRGIPPPNFAGKLPNPHFLPELPPSLFHSSFVPSEEEKLLVSQAVNDAKNVLSVIDDELSRLNSSIAVLESRRTKVEEHIATHQAILSPIRLLPPEILSEIFLFAASESTITWPRCLQHHNDCPHDTPNSGANDIPWRLGAVCSYWRTLLLSLPKLWSIFHLDLSSACLPPHIPVLHLTREIHKFIDTSLIRAGNRLVSFTLKYRSNLSRTPEEDDARELACSALMALVEVSERWEDVTLDLEGFFSFHALLSPARDRVANLRSLRLASSGQSATTPRPWHAIDAFFNAPRLANLTLVRIPHPTHHLRLPWDQLKSLRSHECNFLEGEFTRLLKQSCSLEEFRTEDERVLDMAVTVPAPVGPPPSPNTSSPTMNSAVHLPHLHTLSIVNKGSYISRIFQLITVPSLTNLSIRSRTPYSPEHTISMLRRSSCSLKLRTLSIESSRDLEVVWEENYGIVCLLAETKGVEECFLRVSKAADEIVPRLTVRKGISSNPQRSPVFSSIGPGGGFGTLAGGGSSSGSYGTYQAGIGQMVNSTTATVILPNLKSFSLEDSFCESAAELKEMLQSRIVTSNPVGAAAAGVAGLGGIAHLSKVHLKLSRPAPPSYAELDALKDMARERGVHLNIFV